MLEGLRGLRLEADPVSRLFFHPRNVETLHTSVRYAVYTETGKVIDRQSDHQLNNTMRIVYDEGRRALRGDNVLEQVRWLNSLVVARVTREIVNAISFHAWYMNDISRPNPVPQSRGEYVSSKGTRELRFPHFDSVYGNGANHDNH